MGFFGNNLLTFYEATQHTVPKNLLSELIIPDYRSAAESNVIIVLFCLFLCADDRAEEAETTNWTFGSSPTLEY